MQRLVINSKALYISWVLAFAINIAIFVGFAQLFKFYQIKTSKIYTVYIYNINQNTNAKSQAKQTKYHNFRVANVAEKSSYLKTIKGSSLDSITTNTKKILSAENHKKFKAFAQNDIESLAQTNQLVIKQKENPTQSPQSHSEGTNVAKESSYLKTIKGSSLDLKMTPPIDIKSIPQIATWIEKHKFYPQEAIFKGEEGKIKLMFLIDRNGYLQNISVIEKSQYEILNKAAIKIICNSSPIPHQLLTNVNLPTYAKINIVFRLE